MAEVLTGCLLCNVILLYSPNMTDSDGEGLKAAQMTIFYGGQGIVCDDSRRQGKAFFFGPAKSAPKGVSVKKQNADLPIARRNSLQSFLCRSKFVQVCCKITNAVPRKVLARLGCIVTLSEQPMQHGPWCGQHRPRDSHPLPFLIAYSAWRLPVCTPTRVEKMPQANVRVPDAEVTYDTLLRKTRTTFNKRVPVPKTDTGG